MKQSLYLSLLLCIICSFMQRPSEKMPAKDLVRKNASTVEKDSLVLLKKLSVTGDFDGDGLLDTIFQNNISALTHRQIDSYPISQWDSLEKYFDTIDSDIVLTMKNQKCDTLHLGSGGGLYCLLNIGDNNKDKKDEIALVVDSYNFTNISPCTIYTLCGPKWLELKSFDIHESAFDYEDEKAVNCKRIKGFLEQRNHKWFYIDYTDWFNAEKDKDTILRPFRIKKGC